jgi:hypothetical protein
VSEFEAGVQVNGEASKIEGVSDRVSARLRARREQALAQGLDYDHLADSEPLAFGANEQRSDLQSRVRELESMSDQIWVSVGMQDRQPPRLIRFFSKAENLLHKLVVKYVNRMAGRQLGFNKSMAGTMVSVADRLARVEANQADLQNRLSALEERIADLDQSRKEMEGKDQRL